MVAYAAEHPILEDPRTPEPPFEVRYVVEATLETPTSAPTYVVFSREPVSIDTKETTGGGHNKPSMHSAVYVLTVGTQIAALIDFGDGLEWFDYVVVTNQADIEEYGRTVELTADFVGIETMLWFDMIPFPLVLTDIPAAGIYFRVVEGSMPTSPPELAGADGWALPELESALEAGLIIEDMLGNWKQPTSRLLAAEAIARLVEVSTGKTLEQIAEEKGYDMDNHFADTPSRYATFLREAEVSMGVGNNNYDPTGTFNRAQMVTMLYRIATNVLDMDLSDYQLGTDVFTDEIPNWPGTNEAIGWAAQIEVTTGRTLTTFDSFGTLENQQTGVFSFRAFDKAFNNP